MALADLADPITLHGAAGVLRDNARRLAQLLGVQPDTATKMKMAPGSVNRREPPEGWEVLVAERAEERAAELAGLAARLRAQAAERPDGP